ncbi:MAG: RIP metalloprotease RseP [Azospirillaceae bacterium]|nr:RIP metalloprotease RseP [Azospirillaceae bacterium]
MGFLGGVGSYLVPFLVVLTVLVFVHELGHYLVARWAGIQINVFSIGFGPELFGFNDRRGTRWRLSAFPIGGYVQMFGDQDAASTPGAAVATMTPEERAVSLFHQPLAWRAAVSVAGPAANFIFSLVVLALLFTFVGEPFTPASVGSIQPGSAAEAAGMRPGDLFVEINGRPIERFEDVQQIVRDHAGVALSVVMLRDGQRVSLTATPKMTDTTDRFGHVYHIGLLGVGGASAVFVTRDPATALWEAGRNTVHLTVGILDTVGQVISGSRSTEEFGGPLRIAQMSGEVAQNGITSLIYFMAVLSVNLGLINLFPIPILDGGHLLFYAIEAVCGKPLGLRAQEYGFRIGLALVLTLMIFVTWNDLVQLHVVAFFRDLIS